jgi:hypothetical protein
MTTTTFRTARLLAVVTGLLAMASGAWTAADPGLLHGPEAMQGSARGTALVLALLAVPVLAVSLWQATRGAGWALLTWAGALLYVLYNAVLLLFLTPFNTAFLVYVAMLGTGLWALGYLAAARPLWRVATAVADRAPVRAVAVYVWVVVALNALAWLAKVVPALGGPYPAPLLAGTGLSTNAIYVQDLAVWLPLAAVAAWWLSRRDARGAAVVGPLLGLWVIEGVSVAVDQWMGASADPGSTVVSTSMVAPFLVIAVIGLVPLLAVLRVAPSAGTFGPEPGRDNGRTLEADATGHL